MTSQVMTTEALRAQRQQSASAPSVGVGLLNLETFELSQRIAKMLSTSTLVPEQYRATVKVKDGKDNYGNWLYREEPNPNGLSNCIIALNMANRMGADPLMIMQNLYLIEGRPSWSSQFVMAAINSCGRFSALRFDIQELGEKEVEYTETVWQNRQKQTVTKKITIQNISCVAFAIERETGERIESSKITMEMAVKEGWYQKNGSKWQTMPEQMLRYRAASFFGRVYAPELLMGLRTQEEEYDAIIDITPEPEPTPTKTLDDIKANVIKETAPVEEVANTTQQDIEDAQDIAIDPQPEPAEVKPKKSSSAELKKGYAKSLNNAKDAREVSALESQIVINHDLNEKDLNYLQANIAQLYAKFEKIEADELQALVSQFKEQMTAAQTVEALTQIRTTFSANGTLTDDQHSELNEAFNQKMASLNTPKADPMKSLNLQTELKKDISEVNGLQDLAPIAQKINASKTQLTAGHFNELKQLYADRKTFLENQMNLLEESFFETAIKSIDKATSEQAVFDVTMCPEFQDLTTAEQSTLSSLANKKLTEITNG